jgi:ActR/RegA family two-component response regulator
VAAPTVLILDDDLGFCMWLGRALNVAGIRTVPACRSEDALEIAADPSYRIDLLIVNPQIEGCRDVLDQHKGVKVMAIGGAGNFAADGVLIRPHGETLPPPDRYIEAVNKILNTPRPC